jgi:hypothetical protein
MKKYAEHHEECICEHHEECIYDLKKRCAHDEKHVCTVYCEPEECRPDGINRVKTGCIPVNQCHMFDDIEKMMENLVLEI